MSAASNNMDVDNQAQRDTLDTIHNLVAVVVNGKAKVTALGERSTALETELAECKAELAANVTVVHHGEVRLTALAGQLGITDPQVIASWVNGGVLPAMPAVLAMQDAGHVSQDQNPAPASVVPGQDEVMGGAPEFLNDQSAGVDFDRENTQEPLDNQLVPQENEVMADAGRDQPEAQPAGRTSGQQQIPPPVPQKDEDMSDAGRDQLDGRGAGGSQAGGGDIMDVDSVEDAEARGREQEDNNEEVGPQVGSGAGEDDSNTSGAGEDASHASGDSTESEEDEAIALVRSLQTKVAPYELVGEVMVPRGYVSIQYESQEDIQDGLTELRVRGDEQRHLSDTTIADIERWTIRLGNYSHYMSPCWLAIRLCNLWEMSHGAAGGAAVAHQTAIPEGHHEAIAHIAEELQRIRTSKAWEHVTLADLCFRAWHLYEARWVEIKRQNEESGARRKPGRPQNMAMAEAKDEFLSQDFFNENADNFKGKKELKAERERIRTYLHYGRDLAKFVEDVLGSPTHPDAQALFLLVPFEQVIRLARTKSMELVSEYVRQWVFARMADDNYLVIDGVGRRAKKMKDFTKALVDLMAPYLVRGELLVRLHTDPPARQLGLPPLAQLQSSLNSMIENHLGLDFELTGWPDVLTNLDEDPLDVFAHAKGGRFPDVTWKNEVTGEEVVVGVSKDRLNRVGDAMTNLDVLDVVAVIQASQRLTDWVIVSAMDVQEGNVPVHDDIYKLLVVAKAPKFGAVPSHMLCMAVLISDDRQEGHMCIVDPLPRSTDIDMFCTGIIRPWLPQSVTICVRRILPVNNTNPKRTALQCVAHVIANGIAIIEAGRVWSSFLDKETENEFSVKWRRYAKQVLMCPRLEGLLFDDDGEGGGEGEDDGGEDDGGEDDGGEDGGK